MDPTEATKASGSKNTQEQSENERKADEMLPSDVEPLTTDKGGGWFSGASEDIEAIITTSDSPGESLLENAAVNGDVVEQNVTAEMSVTELIEARETIV